jgi:uncharacterized protein YjiS (DUF1127 family)
VTAKSGHLTVPRAIPSAHGPHALALKVWRLPWRAYLWWRKETSIRQAIRELEELSDHALKDIGLTRGSIEEHVRNAQK